MYTQAAQLKRYHREGHLESATWIITFFAVVLVDVDIGYVSYTIHIQSHTHLVKIKLFKIKINYISRLMFGISVSLVALYIKGWKSRFAVMGNLPKTDLYVNLETHKKAVKVPNINIFQYIGALNFASCGSFKRALYECVNTTEIKKSKNLTDEINSDETKTLKNFRNYGLIIDLSAVTHIDVAACKTLSEIQTDMLAYNTIMYLTCPSDHVFEAIKHAEYLSYGEFNMLPSIHDAVLYFQGTSSHQV